MPVIAIVNPKGGSGKSTLATHLAAGAASRGLPVMLGDVDKQRSSVLWLRRRATQPLARGAPIASWVCDPHNLLRPPPGVTHVVLDTPGGLCGLDLARVLMCADAVLTPVCASVFDRDAAAQAWAELRAHPRVAGGRCKVAMVGMRIDARTKAEEQLRAWAEGLGVPFLGVLRDTQNYVRCIERGLTVFDLPPARSQADRDQWRPVLDWVEAAWQRAETAPVSPAETATPANPRAALRAAPPANSNAAARGAPARPAATGAAPARTVLGDLAAASRPAAPPPPRGLWQRWFGAGLRLAR